jgi:hypothetical protein
MCRLGTNGRREVKNFWRSTICTIIALAACTVAQAKPLGLVMNPSPDVTSGFVDVDYNAGLSNLLVSGFSLSLYDGVQSYNIAGNDTFNINATVNASGIGTAGTLSIQGLVNGMGPNLLTGTLTAGGFGSKNTPGVNLGDNDILEFIFTVTGGDMAAMYGGIGSPVGTILDSNNDSINDGEWTHSWNNGPNDAAVADTAPVPEPTTLALFAIGGIALLRRRIR